MLTYPECYMVIDYLTFLYQIGFIAKILVDSTFTFMIFCCSYYQNDKAVFSYFYFKFVSI